MPCSCQELSNFIGYIQISLGELQCYVWLYIKDDHDISVYYKQSPNYFHTVKTRSDRWLKALKHYDVHCLDDHDSDI